MRAGSSARITKEGQAEMGPCCSSGFGGRAYIPGANLFVKTLSPEDPPVKAPLPSWTAVNLHLHGRVHSFCCVCFQVKTFPFLSDSVIYCFSP